MSTSTASLFNIEADICTLEARIASTDTQTETDELASALRTLRTTRNTLTPFGHLPFDVLARVYNLAAASYFRRWDIANSASASPRRSRPIVAWLQLMSVCSRMREVTLQSPHLWSYLHLDWRPEWFRLCLDRAGARPASVVSDQVTAKGSEQQATRSTNLALLKARLIVEEDANPTSPPLAVIRSLSFRGSEAAWSYSPHWTLPTEMGTSLASLSFRNVCLTLDLPHCPNLTQLAIYHCACSVTELELVRYIAKIAPALQVLHVGWIKAAADKQYTLSLDQSEVLLPHLQTLIIVDDYRPAATILSAFASAMFKLKISTRIDDYDYAIDEYNDNQHWLDMMIAQMCRLALPTAEASLWLQPHLMDGSLDDIFGYSAYTLHEDSSSRMSCTTWQESVTGWANVFQHFPTLNLDREAAEAFFSFAATPLNVRMYPSIIRIIIREGEGSLVKLGAWLDARALAGQPIQMIDFRRCKGYIRAHGTVEEFARQFIGEQARGAVHENGKRVF